QAKWLVPFGRIFLTAEACIYIVCDDHRNTPGNFWLIVSASSGMDLWTGRISPGIDRHGFGYSTYSEPRPTRRLALANLPNHCLFYPYIFNIPGWGLSSR
ncbi:MAG: hypothetical protein ACNA8W_19510, partial [Bradymonadaceae bacterium]